MVVAALAGFAVLLGDRYVVGSAVAAGIIVLGGALPVVVCVALVSGYIAWKRAETRRTAAVEDATSELLAVEVTSLGVAAGLNYDLAVREAVAVSGGAVGSALGGAVRRRVVHRESSTGFVGLDAMESEARRSAATGSPIGKSLDGLVRTMRRDREAEDRARLARLPVKLVFPLALLILPGFVLMTVGPAVLGGLARLDL